MEKIVQVNEEMIRNQLGELVRTSIEDTLNGLLDAEADRLCKAQVATFGRSRQSPGVM